MKIKPTRAYVAKAADKAAMLAATGLSKAHVKCGDVQGENIREPKWALREGERLAVRQCRLELHLFVLQQLIQRLL